MTTRSLAQQMRQEAAQHRSLAKRLDEMAAEMEALLDEGTSGSARAGSAVVPRRLRRPSPRRQVSSTTSTTYTAFRQRNGKKSVRQSVTELLEEEDRAWGPVAVREVLEARGVKVYPPGSPDKGKQVREALKASCGDQGLVTRLDDGTYKATKFVVGSANGQVLAAPPYQGGQ